jgi:hypothetical protein
LELQAVPATSDKVLPLHHFAPVEPFGAEEISHQTNEIIPNILPEPSLSTTRKDFLEKMYLTKVKTSLTEFFGLNIARIHQETSSLESQLLKRYASSIPLGTLIDS